MSYEWEQNFQLPLKVIICQLNLRDISAWDSCLNFF